MVTIINQNENEFEVIQTTIPFEKIREFIQQNAKELADEDFEEEETDIVEYIKKEYPAFYDVCKKRGTFDEALVGGIGMLAKDLGKTEKEAIDMVLDVVNMDGEFGVLGAIVAAETLFLSRQKWIEQNKD